MSETNIVGCRSYPSGTAASRKTPASPTWSSTVAPTCRMLGGLNRLRATLTPVVARSPRHGLCLPQAVLRRCNRLVSLRPPGGGRGRRWRGGGLAQEGGGVRPAGESGRERIQNHSPHLHLLQPSLLQPDSQGWEQSWKTVCRRCYDAQQAPPIFLQDQSDVQMECSSENRPANELSCNVSVPFMKTSSQVGCGDTSHVASVFRSSFSNYGCG